MGWFQRLLGRDPFNPEEYEQVRCDFCSGRGVKVESATPTDPRFGGGNQRAHTCGVCKGNGYVLRKKPD